MPQMVTISAGVMLMLAVALAGQNLSYAPDPAWQAPPEAAARRNPLADSPEAAGGGRKIFQRECSECHGHDGRGRKQAANLQMEAVQAQTDGALFWKITNGNPRRGMPGFSGLPEMQRWQLVLYLRMLAGSESRSR